MLLHHFFKVRNGLEIVGINVTTIERKVRLNVIVKFDHFKVHTFFSKLRFDEIHHVSMWHRRNTDTKGRISQGRCRKCGKTEGRCERDGCKKTGEMHVNLQDVRFAKQSVVIVTRDITGRLQKHQIGVARMKSCAPLRGLEVAMSGECSPTIRASQV